MKALSYPVNTLARSYRRGTIALCMVALTLAITLVLSASAMTSGIVSVTNKNAVISITARNVSWNASVRSQGTFLPIPSDAFFVLVIGNDERPGVGGARADALHLIGINTAEKKVTILNFPRDTTVSIPGHGRNKINAANAFGGSALTTQTVEQLTGVKISYVLEANFAAFTGLIDDLGGIDVTVEKSMRDSASGSNFSPGVVHMSGGQALSFTRDRHSFSSGDLQRSQNQAIVLIAALAEMKKSRTTISSRFEGVAFMAKHLKLTNLTLRDVYFLMEQASAIEPGNISSILVPWAGSNTLAPQATTLFNDFKDDAVLQTYK